MSLILGTFSIIFALVNVAITLFFVLRKEEDKLVKFSLVYGALLIFFCGISALLFESGLKYIGEFVIAAAFITYIMTTIKLGFRIKQRIGEKQKS